MLSPLRKRKAAKKTLRREIERFFVQSEGQRLTGRESIDPQFLPGRVFDSCVNLPLIDLHLRCSFGSDFNAEFRTQVPDSRSRCIHNKSDRGVGHLRRETTGMEKSPLTVDQFELGGRFEEQSDAAVVGELNDTLRQIDHSGPQDPAGLESVRLFV